MKNEPTRATTQRVLPRWPLLILISLWWALTGFGPPVLTSGGIPPTWRLYPGQIQELVAARRMPSVTARAALLGDRKTGQVLLERRADDPLPPASTTKMMTALLTIESTHPSDTVVVPGEALVGDASMGLWAGERLTVEELLYGLLLMSGNDAAMALADYVGGDVDAFVKMMNARAQALGMTATHFVNPHGLDAAGHVSSARDLFTLARAALDQPLFAHIVATREAQIAGRYMVNRNQLLGTYPGADGVKTGTTDLAGECLVASATRDGHQAIAVVLGSQDRYADARALLDHYFERYVWLRLGPAFDDRRRVRLDQEIVRELVPVEEPEILLPRWQVPLLRVYPAIKGDGVDGTAAGYLDYRIGGRTVARVPLVWREP